MHFNEILYIAIQEEFFQQNNFMKQKRISELVLY